MNTRTLQILGVIVAVVVIGVALFLVFGKDTESPTPPSNGNEFPIDTNGNPTQPAEKFTIVLEDGSERQVPNFLSEQQPEVASAENGYQVAGDASTGDYQILYFPSESYFLVSLFVEPLGAVRLSAERELRQKLGLSDADLCALHSEVTTSVHVNELYGGKNLGLSFCPGSVPLP